VVVDNHKVATFFVLDVLGGGGVSCLDTGGSRHEYCVLGWIPLENFKSLKIIFFKKLTDPVRDDMSSETGSPSRVRSETVALSLIVLVVVYHHSVATFLALGGTVFDHRS
jgi:hypothetical protein